MKYEEAYRWAIKVLKELNIDEAEINTWYAMEEVSGISRGMWYIKNFDEMPGDQHQKFAGIIERLAKHEPLSYIIGTRDFCGMTFEVNENVLIPRQDTENLVMHVIDEVKRLSVVIDRPIKIHDLCTGSGCIAISVKKLLEAKGIEAIVSASDISEDALLIATKNASNNSAEINFKKSDMLDDIHEHFDIIISNPPYIPIDQYNELDKMVKDFEPKLALYGGDDGLSFYRIIAKDAKKNLVEGGKIFLEIGFDQGKSVPELLANEGFEEIAVYKDYNELDRNVVATFKGV